VSLSLFDYEGRYYYLIFREVNETITGGTQIAGIVISSCSCH